MPFIIYPQDNAKLAVVSIATGVKVEEAIDSSIPTGIEYAVVDDLGSLDNEYFDAFEYQNMGISCNIAKAKEIHLNKFREARKPKLEAFDVAYSRADESGDAAKKAEIAAQKQSLRDVTKIELPGNLEGIKATWPEILT